MTTMQEVKPVQGLTPEVEAILSAPVPANEIKSYEGKGGKEMRYTSVDFVENRLRSVDRSFGKTVAASGGVIIVHYTVLGVTRGNLFDLDKEGKYGTPATNGLARACRRAAKEFGVARELWEDVEDAPATTTTTTTARSTQKYNPPAAKSTNGQREPGSGGPSRKQIEQLADNGPRDGLHVPEEVYKRLEPGWGNSASKLIEVLFQLRKDNADYYDNPNEYIGQALNQIGLSKLTRYLPEESDADPD